MNLTVLAGPRKRARKTGFGLAYAFEGSKQLPFLRRPATEGGASRTRRNPLALAQEWQRMLDGGVCNSRAGLARRLGVSRARVTQVLGLLELSADLTEVIASLGDHGLRLTVLRRLTLLSSSLLLMGGSRR